MTPQQTEPELPPLPKPDGYIDKSLVSGEIVGIGAITQMHAVEFARAAIAADRAKRVDAAIHYPECWDTAAYPTAASALAQVYAYFRCDNDDCKDCARAIPTTDRASIAGPVLTDAEVMQAMFGDDLNKGEGHPFLVGTDDFIEAGRAIEAVVLAKLQNQQQIIPKIIPSADSEEPAL